MTGKASGLKARFYPESSFGGFSNVDGTVAFYLRIHALLLPESVVIDFGCGRGAYADDPIPLRRDLRIFKGKAARVIGLDVDEAGFSNTHLDDFYLLEGPRWPLPDSSADIIVCDSVVEHLEDPGAFFTEARRTLKEGGCVCIRTPNLWSYVALVSKMVPNRTHTDLLVKVKESTRSQDVFPTLYRCNTIPALRTSLKSCGFEHSVFGYGPEPGYLAFSSFAYWLGRVYQRFAPGFLQPVLFAYGRASRNWSIGEKV
jgi:SAM-dependent methyltransferase